MVASTRRARILVHRRDELRPDAQASPVAGARVRSGFQRRGIRRAATLIGLDSARACPVDTGRQGNAARRSDGRPRARAGRSEGADGLPSDLSGRWLGQDFCCECGSNIGLRLEAVPDIRSLSIGSFDEITWLGAESLPVRHVFTRSRLSVVEIPDGADCYELHFRALACAKRRGRVPRSGRARSRSPRVQGGGGSEPIGTATAAAALDIDAEMPVACGPAGAVGARPRPVAVRPRQIASDGEMCEVDRRIASVADCPVRGSRATRRRRSPLPENDDR